MAEVASAYVTLIPSAKGFAKGIQGQIGGDVERASRSSGERSGKVFARGYLGPLKAIGAAAVGLFAVDKVAGFFKDSIAEARESQKVGALTAQVIKSTGGAAKVSAAQVGELATAISNKSGIDDEAIQSGANLLLTFKNVKNEAGKGNDVFNQATQAITDLGAAMGKDPKAGAIQLGKALNDPVKGITALTRVGVSFTDQQKKQIKAMVKSGDTLGAQKIILHELQSEFGGAAAASATAGDKFKVTFQNFEEAVGTALLPLLDKVLGGATKLFGFLTTRVGPVFAKFQGYLKGSTGPASAFARVMAVIRGVISGVVGWVVGSLIPALRTLGSQVFTALKGYVSSVTKTLQDHAGVVRFVGAIFKVLGLVITQIVLPMLGQIATLLLKILGPAFRVVVAIIDGVVIPVIKFLVKVFLGAVGLLVSGAAKAFGWIPGLGPKLKAAAANFDKFKNQVNAALNGTQDKKTIIVTTPGADAAIKKLAALRYQQDHIDPAVTVRAYVTANKAGFRANGGPVTAGQPYIVGEKRPELFVPNQSGRIIPQVPGGTGSQVNFYGPVGYDPDEIARRIEVRKRNAASVYQLTGV